VCGAAAGQPPDSMLWRVLVYVVVDLAAYGFRWLAACFFWRVELCLPQVMYKAVTTGWFVLVAPPHLGQASWAAEPKKILKLCKSLRKRRHSTSTASGNDWALKNSVVKHITWPGACISLKLNPDCEHLSARLGLAALCTLYLPLLQGVDGRRCLLSHRAALRRSKAL
jgi:hypothetical protein